ncbi:hypothetical protein PENTCL1PPCAC_2968, partial [Pristionchus entomophagus]
EFWSKLDQLIPKCDLDDCEKKDESGFCDSQDLKEICGGGECTLHIDHNTVTCPSKLWLDTGNSFMRHWSSVDRIVCQNGTWNWKNDNGTEWNPIGH